jgi:hypothetical protein
MNATLAMMRKRRFPLCCCPSCLARCPERIRELREAKRMLRDTPDLRPTRGKPKEDTES